MSECRKSFQLITQQLQQPSQHSSLQPFRRSMQTSQRIVLVNPQITFTLQSNGTELMNLRAYPGTIRGTEEWDNTYKIRTAVERDINHIKENLCLAGRRTQNEKTLHADLILAGITQLITVVLADKIKHHEYIRSLKPLIA